MSFSVQARAWVALLVPPLLWYVQEQGLAGPLRVNCHVADGWPAMVWGAASLLLCAANAGVTLPLSRHSRDVGGPVVPWIARLAVAGSGVFALAILFGSLAAALVPACAR
jgi:hypothetical protein